MMMMILHLFQPHQADQMLSAVTLTTTWIVGTHVHHGRTHVPSCTLFRQQQCCYRQKGIRENCHRYVTSSKRLLVLPPL